MLPIGKELISVYWTFHYTEHPLVPRWSLYWGSTVLSYTVRSTTSTTLCEQEVRQVIVSIQRHVCIDPYHLHTILNSYFLLCIYSSGYTNYSGPPHHHPHPRPRELLKILPSPPCSQMLQHCGRAWATGWTCLWKQYPLYAWAGKEWVHSSSNAQHAYTLVSTFTHLSVLVSKCVLCSKGAANIALSTEHPTKLKHQHKPA